MIEISIVNKKFRVSLDPSHKYCSRAYIIVKSMLTTKELTSGNMFSIGYDDLDFLKDKLKSFGLLPYCTITEEAYQFTKWLESERVKDSNYKAGIYNDLASNLLNGKIKTKLYSDQISAISYLLNKNRAGLFDDMGVGKTFISLATIIALGHKVKRSLVVCPSNVIIGFTRQINLHTHLKSVDIPSGNKESINFLRNNIGGNWDIMLVHPENLVVPGKGNNNIYSDVLMTLKSEPWDMIIVDEFHMYKNIGAKRTKCVMRLLSEAKNKDGGRPRVILMTGTPISESPLNAYVVLKMLSFDPIPHISRFQNYYCDKKSIKIGRTKKIRKIVGFKNLDELKTRIERVSIRRTKDDLSGFPDKVVVIRDVFLKGKQLSMYRAICGEVVKELSDKAVINLYSFLNSSNSILRLRQLMNHPNLLNDTGESSKYEEIDYILEEILDNPENKAVIWTAFRKSVENLYDRYHNEYGAVKVYGDLNRDEMKKIERDFENDEDTRVAICTVEKAGTGTDFLARARTSIYVDRPYSYTLYKQSMDRIHRRVREGGNLSKLDRIRSQPATLIFLDAVGTVDELVRDKLIGKQDIVEAMTTANEKLIEIGKEDLLRYLKI